MPASAPTIFAIGGGGFHDEPDNPRLEDCLFSLVDTDRPRVCYIGTACGDADSALLKFYSAFGPRDCVASHISLFRRDGADLREHLLSQDIVYVGGGNTANLLAIWRLHGMDAILREAWERGVVLSGISAGSLCWFEGGVTDSFGDGARAMPDGLGILPYSHSPHYDSEPLRRPNFQAAVASGALGAGYAADDGAALLFRGTDLERVVASRPDSRGFLVERAGDEARETELPVTIL